MGANAELFVFDYSVYHSSIVPAFLKVMTEGVMEDWLRVLVVAREAELGLTVTVPRAFAPRGFREYCTYLDAELAVASIFSSAAGEYDGSWETRSCRHLDCRLRGSCAFHRSQGEQLNLIADAWLRWFEMAIEERCLGPAIFLGRSIDSFFYWKTLNQFGVALDHPNPKTVGTPWSSWIRDGLPGKSWHRGHSWLA